MTFKIDTGTHDEPAIRPISAIADCDGFAIRIPDRKRCESLKRKIIANIQAHEDVEALKAYMEAEGELMRAFRASYPDAWDEVTDAYEWHCFGTLGGKVR